MTQELQGSDVNNTPDAELLSTVEGLTDAQKEQLMPVLEMYSGPIPHPKILSEYEKIYPGAAKAIFKNGIGETTHRRHLENARVWSKIIIAIIATIALFVLTGAFLYFSYSLILKGHVVAGSAFGVTGLLTFFGSVISMVENLTKKDDVSTD